MKALRDIRFPASNFMCCTICVARLRYLFLNCQLAIEMVKTQSFYYL
jgi:hypothetical protein